MPDVKSILSEVKKGTKTFKPEGDSLKALEKFQSTAEILIYCEAQGLLNPFDFKPIKNFQHGKSRWELIQVPESGLTEEGEQHLAEL